MRVLLSTDTVGGVFTYTTALVAAFGAEAEVVVATMGAPLAPGQRQALEDAGAVAVHDGGYALEWMPEPWHEVEAAGEWLLALEAAERPDVVHLSSYSHGALPWRAPCVVVGHSCVLSWWRAVHAAEAPGDWARYRTAVSGGLRGADAVVAPTRALLEELTALYDLETGRCTVIPNGIAPAGGEPAVKEPFILAAGRMWDEAKNLAALDAAAGDLAWPVLVAGPAGAPPSHAQPLGQLSWPELAGVRRRAAIFAAPALYEPFGLAILEAACDGCALVLGDIPTLRELWDRAALFVDPRSARSLRLALEALISDPERRDRLARAARSRATRYSARAMGSAYLKLYSRLSLRSGATV